MIAETIEVVDILEIKKVCRVCLKKSTKMIPLSKKYFDITLAVMIELCSSTTVEWDDDFPKNICNKCQAKLDTAYNFRKLCEASYRNLISSRNNNVIPKRNLRRNTKTVNYDEKIEPLVYCTQENLTEDPFCLKEKCVSKVSVKVESNMEVLKEGQSYIKSEVKDEDDLVSVSVDLITEASDIKSESEYQYEDNQEDGLLKEYNKTSCVVHTKKKNGSRWTCNICSKGFYYKYLLRSHELSHYSEKKYFCNLCDKYYTSEKLHKRIHAIGKPYTCDICHKSFNSKQKVEKHIMVHNSTRIKPFRCDFENCKKSYFEIHGLYRHKLVHNGARNYLCDICSKTYMEKAGLQMHMTVAHMGIKKYKCRLCPKAFVTVGKKNLHEKRHSNIRRHKCEMCEKKFFSKSHVNRHLATHRRDLPFTCRFCSKQFARCDNRSRHETTVHGASLKTTKIEDH